MNPGCDTAKRTARRSALLIVLFASLLWLPTLDELLHVDRALAYDEKRVLADLPDFEFGLNGLKRDIAAWQNCFNDHFGFRLRLLRWYNQLNYRLFGNRHGSGVLKGRDGWLFYGQEDMVQNCRGARPLTPQALADWQRLLERRRDWLAARGSEYLFLVAPNKETIYPQQLPDWLTFVRPKSKLDQFLDYMRSHSTVKVLDLRPALRQARAAPTYLKTDTHWNSLGGFVACQAVASALSYRWPELRPLSLADFEVRTQPGTGGDLAGMLGVDATDLREDNVVLLTPKVVPPSAAGSAGFTNHCATQLRLVVFHDSFGLAMKPFLALSFGRVTCVPLDTLDAGLIAREKPSLVVTEMVERFFNVQDPGQLMAADGL